MPVSLGAGGKFIKFKGIGPNTYTTLLFHHPAV